MYSCLLCAVCDIITGVITNTKNLLSAAESSHCMLYLYTQNSCAYDQENLDPYRLTLGRRVLDFRIYRWVKGPVDKSNCGSGQRQIEADLTRSIIHSKINNIG